MVTLPDGPLVGPAPVPVGGIDSCVVAGHMLPGSEMLGLWVLPVPLGSGGMVMTGRADRVLDGPLTGAWVWIRDPDVGEVGVGVPVPVVLVVLEDAQEVTITADGAWLEGGFPPSPVGRLPD